MTTDLEREAREAAEAIAGDTYARGSIYWDRCVTDCSRAFIAAATLREKELSEVTGERNALIMSVHSKLEAIIAKDDEIASLRAKLAAVPVDEIRRLVFATMLPMLRFDLACIFRWLATVTK